MAIEDILEGLKFFGNKDIPVDEQITPVPGQYKLPGDPSLAEAPLPPVAGRYGLPGPDLSSLSYQDRPDYQAEQKAQAEKNAQKMQVKSLIQSFNRNPATEPNVEMANVVSDNLTNYNPQDPMAARRAEMEAALKDREDRMNATVRSSAANDITDNLLRGMGIDFKIARSADEERKRLEDIKLKNLNEDLALAGKVGTEEKSKQDLINMQALNDPNSPQTIALRNGVRELLGDRIPASVLDKMSGQQLHAIVGKDLASIITSLEDRKIREQDLAFKRDDRDLDRAFKYAQLTAMRDEREAKRKEKEEARKSKGFEALDKDYVKEYNDWTSNGRPLVEKNYQLLNQSQELLNRAKNDLVGTSGRVTGRLPDFLRSEESIRLRDDVHAAAVAALKATLGAQFTEKEGERIKEMSYNEKLSPAENIKKIELAKAYIKELAANNNNKARHFEHERTLGGYQSNTGELKGLPTSSKSGGKVITKKQYSPSRNQTKIIYADGTEEIVDGQK